mgnify:CR=1 FL=1
MMYLAAQLDCPFGANLYEINGAQTKYEYDAFQQPHMDENITQLTTDSCTVAFL